MVTNGNQPNKMASNRDAKGHFLPGTVPNPNGRPRKELSLTSMLKEELTKIAPLKGNKDKTWIQIIVMAWMAGAAKGNPVLLRELLERVDGKVAQPITGAGGGPVEVKNTITVVSDTAKDLTEQILKGENTA